jgi:hypothetical protein
MPMPDRGLFEEPMSPAADRGYEEANQRVVDEGACHHRHHMAAETAARREVSDQCADRHHAGERYQGDVADGYILLAAREQCCVPGGACPRGCHGGAQTGGHRADEFRQCPHGRDADRAGADETHLVAPGVLSELGHRLRARCERREMRYTPGPADQRTDEHRDTDPQAHQMADREEREGQQEIEAGHAAAFAAEAEIPHHIAGEDASRHDAGKCPRDDRAPDHGREAGTAVLDRGGIGVLAAADLEHLGAGDAFWVRQIGLSDQRAPQRDRVHHAEDPAEGADRAADPVWKAVPPADHHHAGQHEDDRRQSAGRRSDGLHDIILLHGHALESAQHRHGNHRCRNRSGEGEAGLESEVDVGRGERHCDEYAQNQAAQR